MVDVLTSHPVNVVVFMVNAIAFGIMWARGRWGWATFWAVLMVSKLPVVIIGATP